MENKQEYPDNKFQVHIKMLTEVWTGNEERKNDYLRETGLLGSLRWWCEALVRGLGGFACDPTGNGCQFKPDKRDESNRVIPRNEQICPVCELFGCTGWSRKFRLRLLRNDGSLKRIKPSPNREFIMEFVWLRGEREEREKELWLLWKSLSIAAKHGSIGGKNVIKPPGEDFGLISIEKVTGVDIVCGIDEIKNHIKQFKNGSKNHPEHPNLSFFFFGKDGYLDKEEIDEFFGKLSYGLRKFFKGNPGESKKIFSFKHENKHENKHEKGRIWGYTRNEEELNEVIQILSKYNIKQIKRGGEVMACSMIFSPIFQINP